MFDESRFRQAIEEATERALQKILPRLVEAARLGASANDAQRSAEAISVRTAAGRSDYSEATVLAAIERGDLSAHRRLCEAVRCVRIGKRGSKIVPLAARTVREQERGAAEDLLPSTPMPPKTLESGEKLGGVYGTRTRGLRRDRPAL